MNKTKILFVCLGNICRSPMAQTVMQSIVDKAGRSADYEIDSAGLISYHEGEPADDRMRNFAYQRGYRITHTSRPIREADFRHFDLIIGMDSDNMQQLIRRAPADSSADLQIMTRYCREHDDQTVPDPYYGGAAGFALVIDLLEDACQGLFDALERKRQ